jgi:hypothetical protein
MTRHGHEMRTARGIVVWSVVGMIVWSIAFAVAL